VEVALAEAPTRVECAGTLKRSGQFSWAVVVANPEGNKELLRLGPFPVQSDMLVRVRPRFSLYTHETEAEMVVDLAEDLDLNGLTVELAGPWPPAARPATDHRMQVPLDLKGLADGVYDVTCRVLRGNEVLADASTQFQKAPPKPNEVKIDHLSRGLVVDGLPFVPFGFYSYYPPKEGLLDGEVVNGFNLYSPYHGGPHLGEALEAVRQYMDRCAAIGMKVNYHLMWANQPDLTEEQWGQLRAEIEAFRDHPALLSWYTADEPSADRAVPLERIHRLVRELDPYHPVTVVFYQGAEHARLFYDALDIVMGDPYPIPSNPVTYVSNMADALNNAFEFSKPLWIVPQAFGGNEWWAREPTAKEQRVMTYLSLIHGARGIQYFIRWPRINFPKSPIMWGECGRLALETAELTPALLSAEKSPPVTSSLPAVHAQAFLDRGVVTLLAVNTENRPQTVRFQLEGIDYTGEAEVLFEDRRVQVQAGAVEEPIDAFGSRAYAIPVGPLPAEDLAIDPKNLTNNPSYEYLPSVGTPEGCYASIGEGATYFVDSRVARHGRHSLRMIAPADDQTPSISPFPVNVEAGKEYRVSIWAKAKTEGVRLQVGLGEIRQEQFPLTTDWQEYSFTCTPPTSGRVGPSLGLKSAGTAWLDLFQIVPVGEE
jgi:hypothetical protein